VPPVVIKRRVVHFGGFQASPPEKKFRHFQRQLARFSGAWNASADSAFVDAGEDIARWTAAAAGPDWRVEVDYVLFCWDDVIRAERERGWLTRLPLGFMAFFDFVLGGAFLAYLRATWRYAAFFLYPFVMIAVLALISANLAKYGLKLSGFEPAGPLRWVVSVVLFAIILPVLGNLMLLDYMLDNWIFARKSVQGPIPEIEARLDRLAALLDAAPDAELLIVGHSFGPVHAAALVDRLIALRPDGPPIRFAALGSSIMKLAVHRGAGRLRGVLTRLSASPRLIWADFTANTDFMNFFKAEPIRSLKLPGNPAIPRAVKFSRMLARKDYRYLQFNLLAMHNQFIQAGARRAPYDFAMLTLGPFALETFANSPEGALGWIGPDGALTEAGRAAIKAP
jgi:hypothetical protein